MTKPPNPPNTDPGQHAPGMSKTLEENAAASEEFSNRKREEGRAQKKPEERALKKSDRNPAATRSFPE